MENDKKNISGDDLKALLKMPLRKRRQYLSGKVEREKKKCDVCHGIMLVAPGQIANYHGPETSPYKGGCRQYRHKRKGYKQLK